VRGAPYVVVGPRSDGTFTVHRTYSSGSSVPRCRVTSHADRRRPVGTREAARLVAVVDDHYACRSCRRIAPDDPALAAPHA
jgi:hypothetical protein